jgi:hypothetical protein
MYQRTDTIENAGDQELEVWFEPWGMPHKLPVGKAFTIVTTAETEGELEIDRSEQIVTVYAFPSATLKVFLGDDLLDDFNVKFPELPPNMTTKGFVRFMFGAPDDP